jgi:hypothetical protein
VRPFARSCGPRGRPAHAAACALLIGLGLPSCARHTPPDKQAAAPSLPEVTAKGASEAPAPSSFPADVVLTAQSSADGTSAEGGVIKRDQALHSESGETRLGWPADKELKGVYAHVGMLGSSAFPRLLDRIAKSGMNAVVVDAKDYSGWLTYPSSIPIAAQTRASSHAVVSSLPELVHSAHQLGIRVLLRVACFHDAWMASHRRDLAIHGVAEWLDPNNTAAQDYLLSIVDETLAAGVDEMQLDYVRYPTENIGQADFGLGRRKTTDVIAGFVQRVHEHTMALGVPLSIDIFGVVAWQRSVDVFATGQDLVRLGAIVEAVSPMVYPSHFSDGFNGYATPGEHPEVVAFGTKQAIEVLKKAGSHAVVRPWIQAFPWHAPGYDTSYVGREIAQARAAEGIGWLAWNAGGYYAEVWAASSMDTKARCRQFDHAPDGTPAVGGVVKHDDRTPAEGGVVKHDDRTPAEGGAVRHDDRTSAHSGVVNSDERGVVTRAEPEACRPTAVQ